MIVKIGFTLLLATVAASRSEAAFIGAYDPANFSLINSNADGLATLQSNGDLLIIGPNNGSGEPGTTDFLIAAIETGIVRFNFYYAALDTPAFDTAGYILGSTYTQLADTDGTSGGPITFAVTAGQTFGFRVATIDNTGEPANFRISNFDAPGAGVPEPGTVVLVGFALASLTAWRRTRR